MNKGIWLHQTDTKGIPVKVAKFFHFNMTHECPMEDLVMELYCEYVSNSLGATKQVEFIVDELRRTGKSSVNMSIGGVGERIIIFELNIES